MQPNQFLRGFLLTLPIMIGIIPLGIIFGAQAVQAGFEPISAIFMPAINFAGGSEFAVIPLWSITPPILLIMATTFLINSRHLVMGAALAPYLTNQPLYRIFLIYFLMCDETWALTLQEMSRLEDKTHKKPNINISFYLGIGGTLWITWLNTCSLGVFLGSISGDLSVYGFDMAMPATFIALCAAMWPLKRYKKDYAKLLPIIAAALVSALVSLKLGSAYSVGLGVLAGITTAFFQASFKRKE